MHKPPEPNMSSSKEVTKDTTQLIKEVHYHGSGGRGGGKTSPAAALPALPAPPIRHICPPSLKLMHIDSSDEEDNVDNEPPTEDTGDGYGIVKAGLFFHNNRPDFLRIIILFLLS